MSKINSIVNVEISIASPAIDSTSFDYLLLVGPKPNASSTVIPAYYEVVTAGTTGALEVVADGNLTDADIEVELSTVTGVSPDLSVTEGDFVLFHDAQIVPSPNQPKSVAVYSDLTEVTDAGWVATGNNADPIGVAARIAFSQSPKPQKIFIAVQENDVDNPTQLEPIETTLNRALATDGWYVICPAGIVSTEYEKIAEWTEAQTKMFAFTSLAIDPGFQVKEFYRTFWIFGRENTAQLAENVPMANNFMHVAWASRTLNYDAGSETWAFKTMAGVNPSSLTTQEERTIEENGGNFYTSVANKNITRPGKVMAGEWIDTIRFRDWLQNDMQKRIYNLFIVNPKIPYTNAGIGLIENQMIASLKSGQAVGGVAETEYDTDGNEVKGFTVKVPKASELTEAQRASRVLTGCKFTARLAGAIHAVDIQGTLTN